MTLSITLVVIPLLSIWDFNSGRKTSMKTDGLFFMQRLDIFIGTGLMFVEMVHPLSIKSNNTLKSMKKSIFLLFIFN